MSGAFLLVLHSHLPFVRGAGRWPHGEEWVHEAILGTYLPLLVALHDLRDDGVPYRLTIGLTPTLLEQLAHREIKDRFLEYLDDQIARADRDRERAGRSATPGAAAGADGDARELAAFYGRSYRSLREAFLLRFGSDVPAAFADLARSGHLELLTSAATHGYLPLLDDVSVRRQLAVGIATTRRITGLDATGIWLPECAYRPGLETLLEEQGLDHFFTDAPLLGGADLTDRQRRAGPGGAGLADRHRRAGPGGAGLADRHRRAGPGVAGLARGPRRFREFWAGAPSGAALSGGARPWPARPAAAADVSRPYLVGDSAVAAIARHPRLAAQVWSAELGYPGDPAYREFHRKDARSGLRYWRVTDRRTGLGAKKTYDVRVAAGRARVHATHFTRSVREELARCERAGGNAMLAVAFDSELFGHWWFEGVEWLGLVLRDLAGITRTSAGLLAAMPPRERIALHEGSWGKDSDHSTWLEPRTEWIWAELRRMASQLDALLPPAAAGLRARAARQAARELLLAQASDWPFLVTTGQAGEYASERFRAHALRFDRALAIARAGTPQDEAELRAMERVDDVFPETTLAGVA